MSEYRKLNFFPTNSIYLVVSSLEMQERLSANYNTVDTGRKLNVHKTFRTPSERLMYVQLCPVSTGKPFYFV